MHDIGLEAVSLIATVIATGLSMSIFGWRVLCRFEDRITASMVSLEGRITNNADKAHAAIGSRIGRVESNMDRMEAGLNQRMDKMEAKIDSIVSALNELNNKVSAALGG